MTNDAKRSSELQIESYLLEFVIGTIIDSNHKKSHFNGALNEVVGVGDVGLVNEWLVKIH